MVKESDVTIIIPHLGSTKEQEYSLDKCLASLKRTVPECNIIVSKNGPDCAHKGDVRTYGDQGQCKAVNSAADQSHTPWLFITNDDMIYAPGWFAKLAGEANLNRLCLSPNLVEPRRGAPPFLEFFAGGAGGDFDEAKWLDYASYPETDYKVEEGFNLPFLIRRDLWDTIEGYDVNYDPWGSNGDSDLQYKIYLAGAKTWRVRNSLVYHFSQTSGTAHPDNRAYWEKNWHYFIDKWGMERKSSPDIWYSKDLIDYAYLQYHPTWEATYK